MNFIYNILISNFAIAPIVQGIAAFFSNDVIKKILDKVNESYGFSLYLPKEAKIFIPIIVFFVLRSIVPILVKFVFKFFIYALGILSVTYFAKNYLLSGIDKKYVDLGLSVFLAAVCSFFLTIVFLKIKNFINNKRRVISMEEIDNLGNGDPKRGGFLFESYISGLYSRMGYDAKTVSELKKLGLVKTKGFDQGADVVVDYYEGNKKIRAIIQCKHYKNKVGNAAVQEVKASLSLYNADFGIVLTNNYFTEAAIELATSNQVKLIDRNKLKQMVELDNSPRINFLVEKIRSQASG